MDIIHVVHFGTFKYPWFFASDALPQSLEEFLMSFPRAPAPDTAKSASSISLDIHTAKRAKTASSSLS